jgi:hypothetical protein
VSMASMGFLWKSNGKWWKILGKMMENDG